MIDMPTNYSQRYNRFFTECKDDYLSYGDSLKKLANFLWEGQIERTDNSMTDLILDETDLCDMKIITTN